ncbi:hypothetical protein MNB_SV-12-628 [hydrothermal vent metagenome]|uniref:Endonuclease GajA/Old nuclease/RecF-like AAA domain-containing protein n=1 Tax=hydrothermal vent metagenome TaxID=652676 RepID=A0A1W1BXW8_9ZZZZ
MERLIVKNFGPLKDIDIELNKINLFIGENGSGKSVLAKIITIVTSAFYEKSEEEVFREFKKYNIDYINKTTKILLFHDEEIVFELKDNKILSYKQIELTDIDIAELFSQMIIDVTTQDKTEENLSLWKKIKNYFSLGIPTPEESKERIKKMMEGLVNIKPNKAIKKPQHYSQYIPAERNIISIFNNSISVFVEADILLPKFLLSFSTEYKKARATISTLNLLNIEYQYKNDRDYIIYDKNDSLKNSLLLEHSSSGIQSALPLYLTVKYFAQKHKSIIIEEPEQNLFPKAQKETVEYIIEHITDGNKLFMMTHSPYVLSTLNILMMAYKAGNLGKESKTEVSQLINEKQWINPDDFSAYYLENGVARDIKGRTGLISDNEIDEISDDIQSDFEELLSIFREHKNDK